MDAVDPSTARELRVPVVGGDLSVLATGNGAPTVVLLHGWGCDRADWEPQLEALQTRALLIAPDLRGFGRSADLPGPYTVTAFAEDVVAVIRHVDGAPVVLVGHSMGAVIAMVVAIAHPELVASVVSLDPSYGVPEEQWPGRAELVARVRAGGAPAAADALRSWAGDALPGLGARLAERARRTRPDVLVESLESLFATPDTLCPQDRSEAMLHLLRRPVLAIHADEDEGAWERAVLGGPPNRTVILPGPGHWLQLDQPNAVNHELEEWLERTAAPA